MSNPSLVEIAGVTLEVDDGLDPVVRTAMLEGRYEAPELRALAAVIEPDDIVMELGTGLGLLSTFCAQRVGGHRVHTFEANPELEVRIRATYRRNGVEPRLAMCMLGRREGTHPFFVQEAFWASSAQAGAGAARVVQVPVRALEDAVERIRPTLLVMDIEGGEHELLSFMDLQGVRRIVLELHERTLGLQATREVVQRLYDAGFAIRRDVSEWEVVCLERTDRLDSARHVALPDVFDSPWRLGGHWVAACHAELMAAVPPGSRYALIDDDAWGSLQVLPGRTRVPFVERDGEYAGPPLDDDHALAELERQCAQGLAHVVFAADSLWWLEHYPRLAERLGQPPTPARDPPPFIAFALDARRG